jgi:hypothetical protein
LPIATGTAIALAAAGALGGAGIGAIGASKAAGAQSRAAMSAAELQHEDAQSALDFQKQMFGTEQQNQAPFLKAGQGAITDLSSLMKNGGFPDWTQQFQAPTAATEENDPGYKFRLQQGMDALQNSAAARGGLLSGNTAKALEDYSQNYASNEYSNVYGRALGEYQQQYNQFQQNQANRFNRLGSLAGLGQISAGQLGQAGQSASGNISNILLGSGQQIGQSLQNAGAARASGYAGVANALGGGIGDLGNLAMLYNLLQKNSANSGLNV